MALEGLIIVVHRAARVLSRSPGFSFAITASLALGIGANLSVFSFVERTVRRHMPYPDAERLVAIGVSRPDGVSWSTADYEFNAWQRTSRAVSGITWIRDGASGTILGGTADRLVGAAAAANLPEVLGIRTAIGRWFTEAEARQMEPVAIVTDGVWRARFGARADIIGRPLLRSDDRLLTIIGVLPPGFELPLQADYWYPRPDLQSVQALARARPGFSIQAIQRELTTLSPGLVSAKEFGMSYKIVVTTLRDRMFGADAPMLRLFAATVFLILVLACTNVANLCLARTLRRRHELAVHVALGASRSRLALHIVAENAILGVAAAAAAVAMSAVATPILARVSPLGLARGTDAPLDLRGVLVAFACGVGAILFVSYAPVATATRGDLRPLMGAVGTSTAGTKTAGRMRSSFVVAQLAIALILVTSCGLLTRSMFALLHIDVGFERHGLILARFQFRTPDGGGTARRAVADELARRVRAINGVQSAALGPPPLIGGRGPTLRAGYSTVFSSRDSTKPGAPHRNIWVKFVDASYLETFRIGILAGRGFQANDDRRAPAVALVNATAARLLFPHGPAVGSRLGNMPSSASGGRPVTVIGVLPDVRQRDLTIPAAPEIWLPVAQQEDVGSRVYISARIGAGIESIAPAIGSIARSIGPTIELSDISTMDAVVRETLRSERFVLSAFVVLGVLALVVAALGVYAVIAYLTAIRTREIGIRIALGAPRRMVVWIITREAIHLSAVGLVVGAPMTYLCGKILAGFLYQVPAWDIPSVSAAAVTLVLAVVTAAMVPALRATRIDPALTLREP